MFWHFSPLLADQVETEITQRDQFNNDDVDISETIVREAIQNSLDAAATDPAQVRVSFRWMDRSSGLSRFFLESLLRDQIPHARAAEVDVDRIAFEEPRALVIEDSGTQGLIGSVTEKDEANFSDFWRRHGKSHKTGKSRGRWGLGKLVFSAVSQLGVFFGVTRREGDPDLHLMGQSVLNLREVNGHKYPPHAFFADLDNAHDPFRRIPVPVRDTGIVQDFVNQFALQRETPGLSVVIPFPEKSFARERMMEVTIANYFYPLITGQLVVTFDDLEINRDNVRQLAREYAAARFHEIDPLFDFIEEVQEAEKHHLLQMNGSWADDKKLDEDDFAPDTLETVRERFARGELVGLYLPLEIKPKQGSVLQSGFSVYIKRPTELERGLDLYVRGGLTLPKEAKFGDRRALGAMIAEDEAICALLGDAENAAHTLWTTNTEKLRKNYRNYRHTQATVTVIKRAVVQLYDLLAEVTDQVDDAALENYFWFDEPEPTRGSRRRKRPQRLPEIPKLEKPKPLFVLGQIKDGFSLSTTEEAESATFPRVVRVLLAYEISRGNAFKKYSPHDFRLEKDITISPSDSIVVREARENQIEFEVKAAPALIQVLGFDPNRDLKIRWRQEAADATDI